MILGVGAGTFAVLLTVGVALLIAIVGSYLAPQWILFIIFGCGLLPFIVYGCILTAPYSYPASSDGTIPINATFDYREKRLPTNTDVIDKFFPVRVVVLLVAALGALAGLGYYIFLLVSAPPYESPRVRCLREQLEEAHPSWYR